MGAIIERMAHIYLYSPSGAVRDKAGFRRALKRLQAQGHEVEVAGSCAEALRLAASRTPDGVILDFCLPKMDGARFLEILRADKLTESVPVVVISAAAARWVAEECQGVQEPRPCG